MDRASAQARAADGAGTHDAGDPEPRRGGITRRSFIGRSGGVALAVGGVGSLLAACGGGDDGGDGGGGEVVVVSWETYITPDMQRAFKEATGITLRGIPAESDEEMFTKLKAGGGSQYDIVFCNCGWAPIYHRNGMTEVFDLGEIAAADDLYPIFRENTDLPYLTGPDQALMYPNMWAALSMIWNVDRFEPSTPPSWNDLWRAPEGKVLLHGSANDFLAMAGLARGVAKEDVYGMSGATLQDAADYLADLKPFQISASSEALTADAFASGKALAGFASSLGIAYKTNTRAGKEVAKTEVPREGTLGWIDGPQLVKDAKNRRNAMAFLEWFGGDVRNQDYMWNTYFFAQCSKTSTERVLAAGGENAEVAKSLGADRPEVAESLSWQRAPEDAAAWARAYDQVVA